MTNNTIHVLLCYRYEDGSLEFEQFTDTDEATKAYAAKEAEVSGESDYEVVLLGADSMDTIMQTHGHYFTKAADRVSESLFSEFLSDPIVK